MKRKSALILLVFASLFLAPLSLAQESAPQMIISWQALDSYAPPFFKGKVLPNQNSAINTRLLVLENGQVQDLSQIEIRWYLNGKLIRSGTGLSETQISFDALASRYNQLSVTLRQYKGDDFEKSVALPIHPPKVTVDASNLLNFKTSEELSLFAHPFFFSSKEISNLLFSWLINNQLIEGTGTSGAQVTINLTQFNSGDTVRLNLEVENLKSTFEKASYEKQFILEN